MAGKFRRCSFCGNTSDDKIISSLFLDWDTSNNSRSNLIPACEDCIKAFKLKRSMNAVITLRALGFVSDRTGKWKYNDRVVRNELVNVAEMEAIIAQLKSEIFNLQGYINMLTKHGYESFDATATGKYRDKKVFVVDKDKKI